MFILRDSCLNLMNFVEATLKLRDVDRRVNIFANYNFIQFNYTNRLLLAMIFFWIMLPEKYSPLLTEVLEFWSAFFESLSTFKPIFLLFCATSHSSGKGSISFTDATFVFKFSFRGTRNWRQLEQRTGVRCCHVNRVNPHGHKNTNISSGIHPLLSSMVETNDGTQHKWEWERETKLNYRHKIISIHLSDLFCLNWNETQRKLRRIEWKNYPHYLTKLRIVKVVFFQIFFDFFCVVGGFFILLWHMYRVLF